ncbi:MAG: autotransporter domain-containing protein [Hyphomicrobiaceae bacterium]
MTCPVTGIPTTAGSTPGVGVQAFYDASDTHPPIHDPDTENNIDLIRDFVVAPPPDADGPTVAITAPASTRGPFEITVTFSENVKGFTRIDLTVGNGTASNFSATSESVYTATITPIAGGIITIDIGTGAAKDFAGNASAAATQVTTSYIDEDGTRKQTQRVVANLLARRSDQITAGTPDIAGRLSGRGGNTPVTLVGLTAIGTGDNNQLSFSTSLRQIVSASEARKLAKRAALGQLYGLGQKSLKPANLAPEPYEYGLDIWIQGRLSHIDNRTSDSDLGQLYLGLEYRVSPTFLVGLLAQFDFTDENDLTQDTAADGNGWLVGPYMAARLHDNLIFDVLASVGESDNDITAAGATGSFDTHRWLLKGRLTGDFNQGDWHFAPHVGLTYFHEKQDAFINSLSILIPEQSVSLGSVTFGPRVSTRLVVHGGTVISPHLGIKGIWDFERTEIVEVATGLSAGSDDIRARVDGGLTVRMINGLALSGEAFYDGIGADDLDVYGGSVKVQMPLN